MSLACLAVLLAGPLAAETATLSYVSEPGDYIGQGQSATYTEADGTFGAARNFDNGVNISFDHGTNSSIWWDLSFAAPFDAELTPGYYPNAQRFPFQDSDRPGLSFSGSGRGCNTLTGEYTVNDVAFDWWGTPRRFSASLEQHCEGATPALFADIDYDFGGIGPASFTDGNILVTYKNLIHELTPSGTVVQTIPVMGYDGTPATEDARDLFYSDFDQLHLFNGTFDPVLSSFDPASGDWRHDTFTDWGIFNNVSYGGIVSFWRFVFVADQISPSGIVRFDTFDDYNAVRFADGKSYIDLNVGSGYQLLYALQSDERTVDIYDPINPFLVSTVVLAQSVRGIAVNYSGEIFGASWDGSIYHFDINGDVLNSIAVGIGSLTDIDLELDTFGPNKQIVVGARSDKIAITDESLASVSTVTLGTSFDTTFVAWVDRFLDPSIHATIEFIDGSGASTNEVIEDDVARVRVTSFWDDLDPGLVDTVTVHLASLYADDFETLVLNEADYGVFEGQIPLAFGTAALENGILETGDSGPPSYLNEQVIAGYVTLDATATVVPNTPPTVTISSPADASTFIEADNIVFTATADDAEDGDLTGDLSWTSSLDGTIGSGGSFSLSTLSVGTHTITAQVEDSVGAQGSDSITVTVDPNTPPTVTISSPADASTFIEDDNIVFTATADDAEDGDLTANLSWTSSLDGTIGSGGSFSLSTLSVGTHTITATVEDSHGEPGSDAITVTVNPNTLPSVTITSPSNGAVFTFTDPVSFAGTASDAEDGDLTANLSWTSSLDGAIGSGGSFSLSTLSLGTHTITATVTDSHGDPGSDAITVTINPNTPPVVTITAPADGSLFTVGDAVAFAATAVDAEDGDISASLSWTSNLDGTIGAGGSFNTTALSVGIHTITAAVTDSHGGNGSDGLSIRILTLPIQVTFTSIAAEDGWVRESNENSDVGGSANSTGAGNRPIRVGDANQDRQYKSILSFDTSSLPAGAILNQATLRLRRGKLVGSNPFNVLGNALVDVQSGSFGGDPTLTAGDFEAAATATGAATLSDAPNDLDWSEGNLDANGRAALNTSGKTQLRVYFSIDDNDNKSNDYMGYYSGDDGTSGNHPQLVVTYQQ